MSIERPALYVVATPLGNLGDLSPRARSTLTDVDLVACEDTRTTKRLCAHAGIHTRLLAVHEHNEQARAVELVARIATETLAVALVSDAGTPLISDPGYRLVQAAHEAGVPVLAVPGPSAPVAALSISGLPTDRFVFEGFLPAKAAARRARLELLIHEPRTLVFFESCHRIAATLADMARAFSPARPACLTRELSKLHEQAVNADLGQLAGWIEDGTIAARGEFVIVVGGGEPADAGDTARRMLAAILPHMPVKAAARATSTVTGLKVNELYVLAQEVKDAD